jgi:hypothetical protein
MTIFTITNQDVTISNEVFERTVSYRENDGAVGVFASKLTPINDCSLYGLDDFDKSITTHIKTKPNERIFRYDSEKIRGIYKILIKINISKGLVYYMTEKAFNSEEDIRFETKGVKVRYMKLSESVI